ncbi:MAG: ABC transporter [Oscillospiraceae bacterium]|nr:ABC transporter [Oscillospiraceae bacterium]
MKAVYKRELESYFNTMTGYVFIAIVSAFIGLYFVLYNLRMGHPYFAAALASTIAVFIFAVPVLTMKSFAEERKTKTDQMLLTYPVSVPSIVLGKFFAMMTVYLIPMLIGCLCPLVIRIVGTGSLVIDYSTILLYLLLGAFFISIGMFVSALTDSQVIAAVVTMAALLVIVIWDAITNYIPETPVASLIGFIVIFFLAAFIIYRTTRCWTAPALIAIFGLVASVACYFLAEDWFQGALGKLLAALSIYGTINNFITYYTFDVKGLLIIVCFIILFVYLTIQAVQRRRWN